MILDSKGEPIQLRQASHPITGEPIVGVFEATFPQLKGVDIIDMSVSDEGKITISLRALKPDT